MAGVRSARRGDGSWHRCSRWWPRAGGRGGGVRDSPTSWFSTAWSVASLPHSCRSPLGNPSHRIPEIPLRAQRPQEQSNQSPIMSCTAQVRVRGAWGIARVGRIDRSAQRLSCARRCRRTEARNAARGSQARAKTPTEREFCSLVQQCALCEERTHSATRPSRSLAKIAMSPWRRKTLGIGVQ